MTFVLSRIFYGHCFNCLANNTGLNMYNYAYLKYYVQAEKSYMDYFTQKEKC